MKNRKTKNFKIIPFLISVLFVLLVTGGICFYTTFYYGNTDTKFLDKYLGIEENSSLIDKNEYIEKFVQLESSKYFLNTKETGLSYRDPETKTIFTEDKNNSLPLRSTDYFKNGVMHVEGYFDIVLYTTLYNSTNSKGEEETTINYTFYFYNINYEKLQSKELNIYIAFVDGVGAGDDTETPTGDLALKYIMGDDSYGADASTIEYNYTYSDKGINGAYYYLYDLGAKISGTDYNVKDDNLSVYKSNLSIAENGGFTYTVDDEEKIVDSMDFSDMKSTTFQIYQYDSETDKAPKAIVEGTIENILTADEAKNLSLNNGYSNVLYKIPSYFKYTWTSIVLFTSIAFVLSSVIATLFYLIWVDEKATNKKK